MTWRWEQDPELSEYSDCGRYVLLNGDEPCALLQLPGWLYALEHSGEPDTSWRSTLFVGQWAWYLNEVCVLIPNEWDDWRLKGLELPPLRDGAVSIDFPPLPEVEATK